MHTVRSLLYPTKSSKSNSSSHARCLPASFAFSRALGPGGVIELSSPPSGMRAVKARSDSHVADSQAAIPNRIFANVADSQAAIPNRIFARMDDNDEADEMDVASGEEESSFSLRLPRMTMMTRT